MAVTSEDETRVGPVCVDTKNGVCTITMTRPHVMNALNDPMINAMQVALDKVGEDQNIHAVVLEGGGENFSSGADMSLLQEELAAPDWIPIMRRLGRLIRTVREIPQPVIAKVRGVAVGGGANLALSADFVVAAHKARFGQVFVNLGVGLDAGGTYFLPRLAGMVKAREFALLGKMISGKEAASIGLIYKSVAEKNLSSEVNSITSELATKSSKALAVIKRALDRGLNMSLGEVLEMEAADQAIMFQSEEHRHAVREFLKSHNASKKT